MKGIGKKLISFNPAHLPGVLQQILWLNTCLFGTLLAITCWHSLYYIPQQQNQELHEIAGNFSTQLQIYVLSSGNLDEENIRKLVDSSSTFSDIDITVEMGSKNWVYARSESPKARLVQSPDGESAASFSPSRISVRKPIYRNQSGELEISGYILFEKYVDYGSWIFYIPASLLALYLVSVVSLVRIYRTLDVESEFLLQQIQHRLQGTKIQASIDSRNNLSLLKRHADEALTLLDSTPAHRSLYTHEQEQTILERSRNTELELAKKSALEASQLKSRIIANTSHELLTPLNSIVGFSDLLLTQYTPKERQRLFAEKIHDNAMHLTALVNDLLENTSGHQGRTSLSYVNVELLDFFQSLAENFSLSVRKKSLHLLTNFDSVRGIQATIDPVRLRQLISNLLVNAIRNTEYGHINLAAQLLLPEAPNNTQQARLLVEISDTGCGIDDTLKKNAFHAFVSGDQPGSTSSPSIADRSKGPNPHANFGLGLSIVNNLADRMGAELRLESQPDHGSTFSIEIPVKFETAADKIQPCYEEIFLFDSYDESRKILSERFSEIAHRVQCFDSLETLIQSVSGLDICSQHLLVINQYNETLDLTHFQQIEALAMTKALLLSPGQYAEDDATQQHHTEEYLRVFDLLLDKPFDTHRLLLAHPSRCRSEKSVIANPDNLQQSIFSGHTPQIFAVDDDSGNIDLLNYLYASLGCEIDTATEGLQALEQIREKKYDLIILDVRMSPLDGIALLEAIRNTTSNASTPTIACTAHTSEKEYRQLKAHSFNDVLHKPVLKTELLRLCKLHIKDANRFSDWFNYCDTEDQTNLPSIPGNETEQIFSSQFALRKSGNDEAKAAMMLELLLEELESVRPEISLWHTLDYVILLEKVHRLHGASCLTGTMRLKQKLAQLESALKNDRAGIQRLVSETKQEVEALLQWASSDNIEAALSCKRV